MKKYQFMIMMIVSGVQVYGASEENTSRRRTSSKEAMEMLKKEEIARTVSPRFQFAQDIRNFQEKKIQDLLAPISSSKDSKTQRKYNALCLFASVLTRYKIALEVIDKDSSEEELLSRQAQLVKDSLALYESSQARIDLIVESKEFIALKAKCDQLLV